MSNESSKKRHIFWYIVVENFLIGVSVSLLGPLLPVVSKDLSINFSKMGIILSLNSLGALISVLITGSIFEIFPNKSKKINELYTILIVISFTGIYFIKSFAIFAFFYFIFGVATGGLGVVTTIILHDLYETKFSIILLQISLFSFAGYTIGPILISIFLNFNLNWRFLFISIVFLQIIIFIYLTFLRFGVKLNLNNKLRFLFHVNRKVILDKKVITSLIISLLQGGIITISFSWLTTFLIDINIPLQTGTVFVILLSASMIISSLLKIVLLKLMKETSIILFSSITSIIFIALFFQTSSIGLKIIFLILFGINITGISTLVVSLCIKAMPDCKSSISGLMSAVTYAGAMVFQYIAGRLSDSYGGISIAYLLLVTLVLLVVASVFLKIINRAKWIAA